jgi:ubiquitin-activating enzyme E1
LAKFKNTFVNLALPLFVITEPSEILRTKSKKLDVIMNAPIKAIPEGFTNYDKIIIKEGSLTFGEIFVWFKEKYGVDV